MSKAEELRQKYPVFEYKSLAWKTEGKDLKIEWQMATGEIEYLPKLTIFGGSEGARKLAKAEVDNLVFHLGLADIFSYWKLTCSPTIQISAGYLDEDQINWWHELLIKGMGQYFYTNQIDFRGKDFVKLVANTTNMTNKTNSIAPSGEKILIPIGGGKDSAVTLELLKRHHGPSKIGTFAINLARSADILVSSRRIAKTAGASELITVHRQLDPLIFSLKDQGYVDGHVPFTAYLSFLAIFLARLFDYSTVVFSNERSSNESNLEYLDHQINHQYTKTFEFEQKFREYNARYLSDLSYLSFLRPLYELQIMKLFSRMNKYFTQFRSCNIGYKNDSWCGKCPKCLAIYVGLFPFVEEGILDKIFKNNLLDNQELLPLARDVLGEGKSKPFECVGTFEETVVAFYLSLKKYSGEKLPILLQFFQNEVLPKYPHIEKLTKEILNSWDSHNNLPDNYAVLLKGNYGAK